jgi:hypothetical protein
LDEQFGMIEAIGKGISTSVVEQLGMIETTAITAVYSVSLGEQLGITDTAVVAAMYYVSIADQFGMIDTATVAAAYSVSLAEQLGIAENTAITSAYSISLADQFGISDNAAITATYSVPLAEQLGMTDTVSKTILQLTSLLEQMGVTVDLQISMSTNRSLSDQLGLADSIVAGTGISTNIVETLTMTDTITSSVIATRAIFDNLAVMDSVSGSPVISITIIDSMSIQDQFMDISATFNLSLIQTIALTQGFATDFSGVFDQVDSEDITISDSVALSLDSIPLMSESMVLQDQIEVSLTPAEVEDDDTQDDRSDNTTSNRRTDHVKHLFESMFITEKTSIPGGGQAVMRNIVDSLVLSTDQMKPLHQRVITVQNVTIAVNLEDVQPASFGGAAAMLNLDITNKNAETENLILRYTYSDPATGEALHTEEQTIAIPPDTSNVRTIQVPFYSEGTYDLMVEVESSDGTLASTDIVVSVPWLPVYLYILLAIATVVVTASISFVFFALRRSLL